MPAQRTDLTSDSPDESAINALVQEGKLKTKDQERAKLAFISTGEPMSEWVIKQGLVTEDDVLMAGAKSANIPFVKLEDKAMSPIALGYVDRAVASRLKAIPFDYKPSTGELYVAMANPLDLAAVEFLEKKTGIKVKIFAASPAEVKDSIDSKYEQSLSTEVTAALKEAGTSGNVEVKTVNIRKVNELIREAPIAKIVTTILEFAIKSRASDVHIEPLEERTRVRYRIDGILHEKLVLPRKIHDSLISRVKILSDMKIDEKRTPQDGRFNFQTDVEEVDLRVSSLPTVHGEKIVMRLLKKTGAVPTLPELGLRGRALKNLEEAVLRPHGIILVTGPTGSGKTTTLYSILSRINTIKVNILTLEDPVEYQIGGVNQVQINPQAGLTFASGLRSFLRQDPNIIMVGEVRDEETAELAIQAALTGHLVFSTLHTNNASGALPRLLDMQSEPYLLASTITAIVGQRVVRRVCDTCRKEYRPNPEVEADIRQVLGSLMPHVKEPMKLLKGEGCQQCGNTGYQGRVGIFEVLPMTEKIGRLILERASSVQIEKVAVDEGMISMKQDGYMKAVEGVTSIDEVLRVAQE
ncbi:MAG: type II secretion system protein E [Candidatus Amesbacteria bacterium GW2011_GWA1_47_16]|uniref:Type II secretion system protein E n=3 Tax=Candidatus Amesiibacteriota TaxID=1752730 RepID=A0A0G1S5J8_9BACT|nr:MAG: type II secretion system protein E [Candidatus Amesbacteria bacterium GW2011_GWA1_47_16]KKU64641.1 MAG: type II secretion system protein E [Candidatus Amesbacteria bacterium GW2011_GWC1_47_15]KKU96566.1 MAG: type II secretion system protein E [Candidatus Amesbacteria bacterium GW2011_GWB1_48_13]